MIAKIENDVRERLGDVVFGVDEDRLEDAALNAVASRGWTLTDLLDDRVFDRNGDELADHGLFVDLPPWGCHLLAVEEDLDHARRA